MGKYVFIRGALESVVWDKEKGAPLAEFSREGLFVTKNKDVAQKLIDLGYRLKSEFPDGPPKYGFDPIETDEGRIDAGRPDVNISVPKTEAAALLRETDSSNSFAEEDSPESVGRKKKKVKKTKKKKVASKKKKIKKTEDDVE